MASGLISYQKTGQGHVAEKFSSVLREKTTAFKICVRATQSNQFLQQFCRGACAGSDTQVIKD
jgi:hypothetical protein